jgi:hypothetical protein
VIAKMAPGDKVERDLDEALEETFPASDPPQMTHPPTEDFVCVLSSLFVHPNNSNLHRAPELHSPRPLGSEVRPT